MERLKARLRLDGADEATIDAFIRYHQENPEVWRYFSQYATRAMKSGVKLGAKCIAENVRYRCELRYRGSFKVSNSWIAYYARAFNVAVNREYFDCKELEGVKTAA